MRIFIFALFYTLISCGVNAQPLAQEFSKPAPYGATNVVDVPCAPNVALNPGYNGSYTGLGSQGWGAMSYNQTGQTLHVSLMSPSDGWAKTSVVVPLGAKEVVGSLTGPLGPSVFIGQVKICSGYSYGGIPRILIRGVVSNRLFVPSPTANDCPPWAVDWCLQQFSRE